MIEFLELIHFEYFLRIILTIIIVFPIAFERESKHKTAGLVTHLLVAIGTTTIGLLQVELSRQIGGVAPDNQRLISQTITGIGFLGAGAIIKTNGSITGLTTAATIWVVAIVGLTIGLGYYALGIYLAVVGIVLLTLIRKLYSKTKEKFTHKID